MRSIRMACVVVFSLVLVFVGGSKCFAAPLTDDATTIGLWHLDSSYGTTTIYTPDDDSVVIGRDNDLIMNPGTSLSASGTGHDGTGKAVIFDGGWNDKIANNIWTADNDEFFLDLWLKVDTVSPGGTQTIAQTGSWAVLLTNVASSYTTTRVGITVYGVSNTWWVNSAYDKIVEGQWQHLQAGLDKDFNPVLMLDGVNVIDGIYGTPNAMKKTNSWFEVGKSYFGMMDEVKLSGAVPEPATMLLLCVGGLGMIHRRNR